MYIYIQRFNKGIAVIIFEWAYRKFYFLLFQYCAEGLDKIRVWVEINEIVSNVWLPDEVTFVQIPFEILAI